MSAGTTAASDTADPGVILAGFAGSPGLAIGRASVVRRTRVAGARHHVGVEQVSSEVSRFRAAAAAAAIALRAVAERVRQGAARAESSILEAYVLMVEDETLHESVTRRIEVERQCAEWALECAVREMADGLRAAADPYLAERSHDFEFVGDRILIELSGQDKPVAAVGAGEPCVIVAHDLSPAETATFDRNRVLGLVTEVGTRTSHTSILARALEIPAVVGVKDLLQLVGEGDLLVVDGTRGQVSVSPSQQFVERSTERVERQRALALDRRRASAVPATTACGVTIELSANIELPVEVDAALAQGAAGIGLYRTEFLYVDRTVPPTEDEQYETYRRVVGAMSPKPVTLRTFDIGGDKFTSALQAPADMNPALGLRAVRLGLARPEVLGAQLRAMVRASAHGTLRILVPMIATVSELAAVRRLLDTAIAAVDAAGQPRAPQIPLGIMVEVPSAAIVADLLARDAEFLSIGTNDLVQYALAVDRTNRELAYLASPLDPAIIRLIDRVVAAGRAEHRSVTVCGAMASDPQDAVLLVGLGLRELSMEAAAIPRVKAALGRITLADAERLAERVRALRTAAEAGALLDAVLLERLSDLVLDD
ncbi:MAG: phosphoenolpyruvate--protein phosphotransferase [Polyangiaceae bacterium]|nr:phosphoenolpyruvate--protein phosphotransferase [Polyangiaceae bacterium]